MYAGKLHRLGLDNKVTEAKISAMLAQQSERAGVPRLPFRCDGSKRVGNRRVNCGYMPTVSKSKKDRSLKFIEAGVKENVRFSHLQSVLFCVVLLR